jgi:hypothetical protein
MSVVVDQGELALSREPKHMTIPIELIRSKKTSGAAITLACDSSGLDDKEIYLPLGIDAGYFSNIKKGKATLQGDLLKEFCKVVGNSVYPEWCAYQVGCTLVMIQTEAERRAEAEKKRADAAELKLSVLMETFRVRAAA